MVASRPAGGSQRPRTVDPVRRMHRLDASDLEVELADARAYVEAVKGRNRGPVPTIVRRRGW